MFQEFFGEPAEAEVFLLGGETGDGGVGVGLARSSRFLGDEEELRRPLGGGVSKKFDLYKDYFKLNTNLQHF